MTNFAFLLSSPQLEFFIEKAVAVERALYVGIMAHIFQI